MPRTTAIRATASSTSTRRTGPQTGDTIDIHATGGIWQADGTYNARTGMLWEVNVGGDMCLFEMDPVAKAVTGRKICGPWSSSQRAVAYDYATDTYYVGGTNDATVYHVDGSGNLLDSAYVGLGIAGLAYNPGTRHLFVASEFRGAVQRLDRGPEQRVRHPERLRRDQRWSSGVPELDGQPGSRL